MGPPRPRRRATDHAHEEYWRKDDHNRYEDKTAAEIHALREDVKSFSQKFAWLMGVLAVLVFIANAFSVYVLRVLLPPN